MFANDPNLILSQHHELKKLNKERLKEVKNLEDLINFQVKTVADEIKN
jgi:hypothetical protein